MRAPNVLSVLPLAACSAAVSLLVTACGDGGRAGASPATPAVQDAGQAAMAAPMDPTGPPAPADVTVAAAQNGGHIPLRLGQTLAVQLTGNPGTGYVWELKSVDTTVLQRQGEVSYTPVNPAASPRPGSSPGTGGTFTARFRALRAGDTWLTLVYHRPFDLKKPPSQTFSAHVMVS